MNLVELIVANRLTEAKQLIFNRLDEHFEEKLEEEKQFIGSNIYIESDEPIEEASPNVIKIGRIKKIRRRIRRNKKGRIIVQKNIRKSAIKGFRISVNNLLHFTIVIIFIFFSAASLNPIILLICSMNNVLQSRAFCIYIPEFL